MKTTVLTLFIIFFSVSYVAGQKETPDLKLDVYKIIGKDTRVFTITGDRYSTIKYVPMPVVQPREERDIETSKGLIGEDERLVREEIFSVNYGLYTGIDALSGIKTPFVFWGKASADLVGKAATIRYSNRMAKQNTPTNEAPLVQDLEAAGYYDASFGRFSVDVRYDREDDEINSEFFRNRNRLVNRYHGGVTMRMALPETWEASGRLTISGSNYKDAEIFTAGTDEGVISGDARAAGDFGATTVVLNASGSRIELGDSMGTIFSALGMGEWLFGRSFSVKAGISFTASRLPDEDTKVRLYPRAEIDWAIVPGMFIKAAFRSGVKRYSFTDLYSMNGLITYDVPMLFEDRKIDASGEFGLKFSSGIKTSVEGFYTSSENMPLFTRWSRPSDNTAVFYRIFNAGVVDLTGAKLKASYDKNEFWGIDGSMTFTDATSNSTDNVPYIPQVKAELDAYYMFRQVWKIRGSVCFYGQHYSYWNQNVKEDSFLTLDLGVDRKVWKEYLSMYVELRNLMNARGYWWTSPYRIPGPGMYAGLKATY